LPLDDLVQQAMTRWPNVPAMFGWLRLDRRGRWMLIDRGAPGFDEALHGAGSEITSPPIIDFIGRWSMLDLFVISLMVALVDRGVLLNVRAGPGATAFAGVVVLTMMSARMLDTRLLWDKAAR
jgi:hypothetical protein